MKGRSNSVTFRVNFSAMRPCAHKLSGCIDLSKHFQIFENAPEIGRDLKQLFSIENNNYRRQRNIKWGGGEIDGITSLWRTIVAMGAYEVAVCSSWPAYQGPLLDFWILSPNPRYPPPKGRGHTAPEGQKKKIKFFFKNSIFFDGNGIICVHTSQKVYSLLY